MRKNSPRKWLHAILDLLPVLILPIFGLAVRSDNNFQPIEVQTQNYEVVNFNQLGYINSDPYDIEYIFENDLVDNYSYVSNYIELENNHIYLFNYQFNNNGDGTFYTYVNNTYTPLTNNELVQYRSSTYFEDNSWAVISEPSSSTKTYNGKLIFNFYDLTKMFGAGNEPTIQNFNTWYPNHFYEYTLSHKELLNVGTTTLSDTDLGSQMVYTLYNATDKYFNMNSVFNLNSVWSWIQLNIFNGNVPLVAYIIWQVIIYEFIVDILFIFYAFFMFLIDFCEYLLEKPFNKINRGK